ncbi:hypothetical protein NDU88_004434 [Pleurodeles waltl]|uniref:Uncharacterized protein n=1 Tax=Pleurodeles waltl TaxID=8319 RepID=A0AAV7MA29_PLEWA|nr:hypothetical protein NDU88_004434 [Pleurodeles waltl]
MGPASAPDGDTTLPKMFYTTFRKLKESFPGAGKAGCSYSCRGGGGKTGIEGTTSGSRSEHTGDSGCLTGFEGETRLATGDGAGEPSYDLGLGKSDVGKTAFEDRCQELSRRFFLCFLFVDFVE